MIPPDRTHHWLRQLALWALLLTTLPAFAQAPSAPARGATVALPHTFRVATRVVPPFVTQEEGGQLGGFSMELWQAIALRMGVQSQFVVRPTVKDLLTTVGSGRADLGISAISITAERDRDFDFSQPMFESGLQIMVRDKPGHGGMLASLRSVFGPTLLQMVGLILLLILVPAHVVWFAERRHPSGMLDSKHYFPGIFEAAWWALSTLATQADSMPRSGLGRVVAVIWMFTGVAFVAYFTAALTTAQTVQSLQGDIQGVDDLPGKRVATLTGSTASEYLHQHGVRDVQEFSSIADAGDALEQGRVDAVVYDAPVLLYYAGHDGKGKVRMVGSIFRKENYGIVFPSDSPYRKPVNAALLSLREDGTYDKLYNFWFGDSGNGGS